MKTYRNLYPQVTEFINLYVAFHKARKGKRHRPEVAEFAYNLEPNLFELQAETCRGRPSYDLVDKIACGPSPARANAPPCRWPNS